MRNRAKIIKMRHYAQKLINYTKGLEYRDFVKNAMLVEACSFNLSQIGECAHKVSKDFQAKRTDIPWKSLYALRNQIVHEYEGVNMVIVWDIITEDLPDLVRKFNKIIDGKR
jgi:uncharacterized protein with HEPN domain